MATKRILLTWELGGGLGHIVRLTAIGKLLVDQGHQVTIAVPDKLRLPSYLGYPGIDVIQAPTYPGKRDQRFHLARNFADILLHEGFADARLSAQHFNNWRKFIDQARADVQFFDHSPMSLLASQGNAAVKAVVGTGFCIPPALQQLPLWRIIHNHPYGSPEAAHELLRCSINRQLDSIGCKSIGSVGELYGCVDRQYLQTYSELDHFPNRKDANYCGILEPSFKTEPCWPDGPGKRTFAYLRNIPETRVIIKLLSLLRMPTVAFIPGSTPDQFIDCTRDRRRFAFCRNRLMSLQQWPIVIWSFIMEPMG